MNKLLKSLLTLGLVGLTNLYGDCCCNPCSAVTLDSSPYIFDAKVGVLYLQPSGSNLHYVAEAEPLPIYTPDWKIYDIHPDSHFGYELGLSLFDSERHSKLSLDYAHFNSKDTSSKNVNVVDMLGPFFEIGPDGAPYNHAKGKVNFRYDALDLDYGIQVHFGDYLHTNFFAGIGAVRIKQDLLAHYSNNDGTIARTIKTPSTFLGMGPEVGANFSYDIFCGFQLTGLAKGALLVGNLKNHTSYHSISQVPDISPVNQTTHVQNRTQVVPAFETKLGLAYNYNFCDYAIDFDVGYQVLVYFNAIQSVDIGSEVIDLATKPAAVGVFARTFQRNISNFALSGPYLKLEIGF